MANVKDSVFYFFNGFGLGSNYKIAKNFSFNCDLAIGKADLGEGVSHFSKKRYYNIESYFMLEFLELFSVRVGYLHNSAGLSKPLIGLNMFLKMPLVFDSFMIIPRIDFINYDYLFAGRNLGFITVSVQIPVFYSKKSF